MLSINTNRDRNTSYLEEKMLDFKRKMNLTNSYNHAFI